MLRNALGSLQADLVTGAFVFRPLPPLVEGESRVLRRIPDRWRRSARWLPHAVVLALAALVFLLGITGGSWQSTAGEQAGVAVFTAFPVVLSLFRPVGAFWISLGTMALLAATWVGGWEATYPWSVAGFVAHLVVIVQVVLRFSGPRIAGEMWVLTVVSGIVVAWVTGEDGADEIVGMGVASALLLSGALLVHGWTSARLEVAAKEQEVAAKEREVVAKEEVTRAERSKRFLLEERTTIARELHDVVAHHMSVVAIQAEAAPYRVENPPPELAQAFATIRENAVAALAELRRVLGVVRAEDYEAPDAPQPTLADLDALLANVRDTGLTVQQTVTGAVRELPQGVGLSAYRIVQEALSNAMRHAPGATAQVEVAYVLGGLGLRVVNGPPTAEVPPSPGAGHGLTGMRERVSMLGGEMTAEGLDDGGYEVAVFLPVAVADGGERGVPGDGEGERVEDEGGA
ncbi:Sensor histidine kinase LiaS [Streptomyces sp. YIM 130001]|uniref:sensor histidine kinase n=1 Tax=Streptomyces sp. YIM 130001 TaxID=2259644 RepID=UPI000E646FAA|nr:histidine kinase [Streptomyces sp. YIM 130001]RII08576.1 Sensor histidine kinase LiaS [Streptomyces sp. YIM 130001]